VKLSRGGSADDLSGGPPEQLGEQVYILERATTREVASSLVKNIFPTCCQCLTISTCEALDNRRPD
jgi:hypothetical protein